MKERSLRVIVACTTFCLFFLISNLTHRVELVKGTAGLAYAAVLSMPTNLSGTPGQTGVVAPINVDNATGIAGVDVTLDFDPLILTATDVQLTTLTSGFSLVSNLTTPGRVVISMARSTGITSGSGALANVIFTVSSSITQESTALTFQSASLFDENASPISVSTQNGLFTVSSTLVIYVSLDGKCNGNYPCFSTIQNALVYTSNASAPSLIEITQETYNDENILLDFDRAITLQGGWKTDFSSISSSTTIQGSITITNGTMMLENIILK